MKNRSLPFSHELARRDFVQSLGAGLAMMSFPALGRHGVLQEPTWPGLREATVINMLGGLSNPNNRLRPEQQAAQRDQAIPLSIALDERALADARASGVTATNVTVGYVAGPMDPFEHSVRTIAELNRTVVAYPNALIKVLSASDIVKAKSEQKIAIIFGFQNAAMMGDDASRAEIFAGLGVKVVQLTYNVRNQIGDGSMEPEGRGLTPFGHEVVQNLNATNTLVDLSHSGEQTCLDAIRASTAPICISHTGCRALADTPRNKTDAELRLLAERGGVVGIYFMPFLKEDSFPDASDVVRHIEHAILVCGEDHVGIGTDGGTTQVDDLEAYRAVINREIAQRRAAGISATGERPGVVPFVPDLQGPQQFQKLADLLFRRGHSSARIEKVLGGNFLRLLGEVWLG